MAFTQTDINNLNLALARGEKTVRIGDKWVEYHSPEQIIKARDDLQRQLNAETPRTRIVYHTQSGRGY